ncbi:MAG: pyrroline-5-carboxylate reductase [Acidimicrobiales bacterium]|nr:pyrroline-5-carboxylate reductase [Acidimicrobiales bacterium]
MHVLEIVGGGRMGEALLGGLIAGGWSPGDLAVVEALPARRDQLAERFPDVTVTSEPLDASGAVVAVKPGDVPDAVGAAVARGAGRILSIAAGVTLHQLQTAAGDGVPVVRAMPNTPALVGAGASAIAGGDAATDDDLDWAESVLGAVGIVVRVTESQLDAVTGLSGSGPAYVFLVAEALTEAGVFVGLPRDTAATLVGQTLLGSATLLTSSDDGPEALRAAVTSPGGTTAAGLKALESAGVRAAFADAVVAAAERAREMGRDSR